MKMMIMSMNMLSAMLPTLNHPISMGAMLLIQSTMTAMLTMMLTKNSWFPMILFITFSGGIMIMFIYMASIASNEKFKFSPKMMIMMMTIFLLTMLMYKDKVMLMENKWMEMSLSFKKNEESKSIIKFLMTNKKVMSMMLMMIILMMLISITSIINSFEGPLKMT
uniref:NADH dehydrogenase subunit 6 n=1 Tax=Ugyops sp. APL-2018 TaxID=2250388 RepID=A0A3G1RJB1_9HEMI|nr:NADH dehydrogenase subunit 6 [Ugyops sp. APL-2018]